MISSNANDFRKKFLQLERTNSEGQKIIYFDNGASTLKHGDVTEHINRINRFETSNVHRGAHQVSREATENYEAARENIKNLVNAQNSSEIIFTRGTTEGINFVASGMAERLKPGDEVLISPFEHHSNIVPWQILCEKTGAHLKVIEFDPQQGVTLEAFQASLTDKTRLVALIHYSNGFGNKLPVEKMVDICKTRNILTLVDSAQAIATTAIDVQKLQCDFLVFSGHKLYAPFGIGALYINSSLLEDWPPYQGGGSMIDRVTFEKTTYANAPQKFEAGTPNISGAIGLGEAAQIQMQLHKTDFHQYVLGLRTQLIEGLKQFPQVQVYNFSSEDYSGVVSFNIKGAHCSDVGSLLDKYGIAVRAGHHCNQPLMDLMNVPGTVRASLAPYNTRDEVRTFIGTMAKVEGFF